MVRKIDRLNTTLYFDLRFAVVKMKTNNMAGVFPHLLPLCSLSLSLSQSLSHVRTKQKEKSTTQAKHSNNTDFIRFNFFFRP